jgi:hypothetical protein
MISRNRPARVAVAVGATLAAGTVTMLAVTTTASADEPGRCTQNVNVREKPDASSRIVALCEEGTRVKLGEKRAGFVRIDELGGWAAEGYVKADARSGSSSSASSSDGERDGSDGERDATERSSSGSSDRSGSEESDSEESDSEESGSEESDRSGGDTPREARVSTDRGWFGGLFG